MFTDEEWQKKLTPKQYHVLRKKGTEHPFTGELLKNDEDGVYLCAGCESKLFHSDAKYDSGSGWPSFFESISESCIATKTDDSHNMIRVEILCSQCNGHLGHLFQDGPEQTGLRYCVNSLSLKFNKI